MHSFLLEPQNIIIQNDDQGQQKETESQIMVNLNTSVGEEAKIELRSKEAELKGLPAHIAK